MSFGTFHTPTFDGGLMHPSARKILAAAHVNNLTLTIPYMKYGEANKTPSYLAKFPLGKVPAFESPSGDFCLWESDAIAYYIASSGPLSSQLLGSTPEEQAKVQQWIHFCTCHIRETVLGLASWRLGFGAYDQAKEDASLKDLDRWLEHIEGELKKDGGREWLVKGGKGASLADLTVAGMFWMGLVTVMDKEFRGKYPETFKWYERVSKVKGLEEIFKGDWIEAKKVKPDDA